MALSIVISGSADTTNASLINPNANPAFSAAIG